MIPTLRRASGWGAAMAIAAAAASLPSRAAAAPVAVSLTSHGGRVQATIELGPALPAELTSRLGNGLQNVLAIWVGVVPAAAGEPALAQARVIEVLFDVWEETWTVTTRDPRNPEGRRRVVATAGELRQLVAHAADGELGPVADLPASRFTVEVRIDLNPVSPELLARTREYLAGAAGRPGGASRSVLGTVAGFMLREPEGDGDLLLFRSGPLTREAVKAR